MYVEIIPREVADVMREPLMASEKCGLINDSFGFESLHDAILNAEHIGSRVLGYVEPENLFFIFCQTVQSLGHATIKCPPTPPLFDERDCIGGHRDGKKRNGDDKGKPKHRAVVLCKLRDADTLKELAIWKKEDCRYYAERYEIAWREVQELKKCFYDLGGDHFKRPNND